MRAIDGDALEQDGWCMIRTVRINETTLEYQTRKPTDFPTIEPKKGRWIDYSDEGFVECPFCHSATNCDGNKEELHFCFSCGADMREGD